jgi:hypothetical protein
VVISWDFLHIGLLQCICPLDNMTCILSPVFSGFANLEISSVNTIGDYVLMGFPLSSSQACVFMGLYMLVSLLLRVCWEYFPTGFKFDFYKSIKWLGRNEFQRIGIVLPCWFRVSLYTTSLTLICVPRDVRWYLPRRLIIIEWSNHKVFYINKLFEVYRWVGKDIKNNNWPVTSQSCCSQEATKELIWT